MESHKIHVPNHQPVSDVHSTTANATQNIITPKKPEKLAKWTAGWDQLGLPPRINQPQSIQGTLAVNYHIPHEKFLLIVDTLRKKKSITFRLVGVLFS